MLPESSTIRMCVAAKSLVRLSFLSTQYNENLSPNNVFTCEYVYMPERERKKKRQGKREHR